MSVNSPGCHIYMENNRQQITHLLTNTSNATPKDLTHFCKQNKILVWVMILNLHLKIYPDFGSC